MKTKVYIASPYTKGNKARNLKRHFAVTDQLLTLGFAPFAPLLFHYQHLAHPRPYDDWISIDLEWVAACDVLLRLPGASAGADGEVVHAVTLGIPVVYSVDDLIEGFT